MTSAPIIQGWCPGALRPMASGDGYVVRVRPLAGRLAAAQANGIAELAARHGNGLIDLSARANVQLRGVTPASHAPLIAGLRGLGLIDATAEAEARRNIITAPFWQPDDGTSALVAELTAALAAADAPDLPGKFGFAVDLGPLPLLQAVSSDIRLERADDKVLVRADGAREGAIVTASDAVAAALELARWFAASGGIQGGRGRMAAHLSRGAQLPLRFTEAGMTIGAPNAPTPGAQAQGWLVGFEFGQMQAATLQALAAFGPLRVTPWRMLLIEGATSAPNLPELITSPDDARLRVIACTGAPGCVQALAATRPLARALAPFVPRGSLLHVSGCTKGCALPGQAPLTLVAESTGFGVIRHGTAATPPTEIRDVADLCRAPATLFESP